MGNIYTIGSTRTDFAYQLDGLNHDNFTLISWDPPGYGFSRPPNRDWDDFYRKDVRILSQLLKVHLIRIHLTKD